MYIGSAAKNVNVGVVTHVARWVGDMLRMFGLGEGVMEREEVGWGDIIEGDASSSGDVCYFPMINGFEMLIPVFFSFKKREATVMPYLNALSTFRDGVRKLAIAKNETALKDILALCDQLRDETMVPLGVALDDQEGAIASRRHKTMCSCLFTDGKALVKLVSPAELIRAREEKRALIDAKASKKAASVAAERAKRVQKLEKGSVKAEDMFKPPHVPGGTYGSWNDDGVPLTDGEGKELSKSAAKKVVKDWATQKKARSDYEAWVEAGKP